MNESPAQDYGLLPKTEPAHINTTLTSSKHKPTTEHY